ncbi:hypothetical protein [Streptomyces sp. NPDC020362]|uniref:hypothetical protein n=1 Tax=unclassified Streptomyces TaxID=2593676 RepID=UPI000B03A8B0
MTPWLRLTLRFVRLLLVLATAAPVYGTATAYGAEAAPADSATPAARPVSSASSSASPTARVPASAAALVSVAPSSRAPEPSRAGSRAGEGRIRPGRPDGPAAEEEGDDDTGPVTRDPEDPEDPEPDAAYPQEPETADAPVGTSTASDSPREAGLDPARPALPPADQNAVHQGGGPAEPTLQILPLGSGLVLIGLGLGLALLGMRVRRS